LEEQNLHIVKSDVFQYLKNRVLDVDFVFIDPPFTEKLGDKIMRFLSTEVKFSSSPTVIIETSKFEDFQLEYPPWKCYDQRKFGDKNLSFFRR